MLLAVIILPINQDYTNEKFQWHHRESSPRPSGLWRSVSTKHLVCLAKTVHFEALHDPFPPTVDLIWKTVPGERKYCGFIFLRPLHNISLGFVWKDAEYRTLDSCVESNTGDFTKISLLCWQLRRRFRWRANRNYWRIALKKLGQLDELQ